MMKYVVESFYDDAKVTVETNDPEVAVLEMVHRDMEEVHAHCFSGETGEILAIINCPSGEDYSTPEFALMTLGVLMAHQMEQVEEPATEHGGELMVIPENADLPAELVALLGVLRAISEQ